MSSAHSPVFSRKVSPGGGFANPSTAGVAPSAASAAGTQTLYLHSHILSSHSFTVDGVSCSALIVDGDMGSERSVAATASPNTPATTKDPHLYSRVVLFRDGYLLRESLSLLHYLRSIAPSSPLASPSRGGTGLPSSGASRVPQAELHGDVMCPFPPLVCCSHVSPRGQHVVAVGINHHHTLTSPSQSSLLLFREDGTDATTSVPLPVASLLDSSASPITQPGDSILQLFFFNPAATVAFGGGGGGGDQLQARSTTASEQALSDRIVLCVLTAHRVQLVEFYLNWEAFQTSSSGSGSLVTIAPASVLWSVDGQYTRGAMCRTFGHLALLTTAHRGNDGGDGDGGTGWEADENGASHVEVHVYLNATFEDESLVRYVRLEDARQQKTQATVMLDKAVTAMFQQYEGKNRRGGERDRMKASLGGGPQRRGQLLSGTPILVGVMQQTSLEPLDVEWRVTVNRSLLCIPYREKAYGESATDRLYMQTFELQVLPGCRYSCNLIRKGGEPCTCLSSTHHGSLVGLEGGSSYHYSEWQHRKSLEAWEGGASYEACATRRAPQQQYHIRVGYLGLVLLASEASSQWSSNEPDSTAMPSPPVSCVSTSAIPTLQMGFISPQSSPCTAHSPVNSGLYIFRLHAHTGEFHCTDYRSRHSLMFGDPEQYASPSGGDDASSSEEERRDGRDHQTASIQSLIAMYGPVRGVSILPYFPPCEPAVSSPNPGRSMAEMMSLCTTSLHGVFTFASGVVLHLQLLLTDDLQLHYVVVQHYLTTGSPGSDLQMEQVRSPPLTSDRLLPSVVAVQRAPPQVSGTQQWTLSLISQLALAKDTTASRVEMVCTIPVPTGADSSTGGSPRVCLHGGAITSHGLTVGLSVSYAGETDATTTTTRMGSQPTHVMVLPHLGWAYAYLTRLTSPQPSPPPLYLLSAAYNPSARLTAPVLLTPSDLRSWSCLPLSALAASCVSEALQELSGGTEISRCWDRVSAALSMPSDVPWHLDDVAHVIHVTAPFAAAAPLTVSLKPPPSQSSFTGQVETWRVSAVKVCQLVDSTTLALVHVQGPTHREQWVFSCPAEDGTGEPRGFHCDGVLPGTASSSLTVLPCGTVAVVLPPSAALNGGVRVEWWLRCYADPWGDRSTVATVAASEGSPPQRWEYVRLDPTTTTTVGAQSPSSCASTTFPAGTACIQFFPSTTGYALFSSYGSAVYSMGQAASLPHGGVLRSPALTLSLCHQPAARKVQAYHPDVLLELIGLSEWRLTFKILQSLHQQILQDVQAARRTAEAEMFRLAQEWCGGLGSEVGKSEKKEAAITRCYAEVSLPESTVLSIQWRTAHQLSIRSAEAEEVVAGLMDLLPRVHLPLLGDRASEERLRQLVRALRAATGPLKESVDEAGIRFYVYHCLHEAPKNAKDGRDNEKGTTALTDDEVEPPCAGVLPARSLRAMVLQGGGAAAHQEEPIPHGTGWIWARLSDSQGALLRHLFPAAPSNGFSSPADPSSSTASITWEAVRRAAVPFWLNDDELLRQLVERVAASTFHRTKDVTQCATSYILARRTPVLMALCHSQNLTRLEAFFRRNFQERQHKEAAAANAFAAAQKGLVEYSLGYFILAGDVKSAVLVALQRLRDPCLALVVLRLGTMGYREVDERREIMEWYHKVRAEETRCGELSMCEMACLQWCTYARVGGSEPAAAKALTCLLQAPLTSSAVLGQLWFAILARPDVAAALASHRVPQLLDGVAALQLGRWCGVRGMWSLAQLYYRSVQLHADEVVRNRTTAAVQAAPVATRRTVAYDIASGSLAFPMDDDDDDDVMELNMSHSQPANTKEDSSLKLDEAAASSPVQWGERARELLAAELTVIRQCCLEVYREKSAAECVQALVMAAVAPLPFLHAQADLLPEMLGALLELLRSVLLPFMTTHQWVDSGTGRLPREPAAVTMVSPDLVSTSQRVVSEAYTSLTTFSPSSPFSPGGFSAVTKSQGGGGGSAGAGGSSYPSSVAMVACPLTAVCRALCAGLVQPTVLGCGLATALLQVPVSTERLQAGVTSKGMETPTKVSELTAFFLALLYYWNIYLDAMRSGEEEDDGDEMDSGVGSMLSVARVPGSPPPPAPLNVFQKMELKMKESSFSTAFDENDSGTATTTPFVTPSAAAMSALEESSSPLSVSHGSACSRWFRGTSYLSVAEVLAPLFYSSGPLPSPESSHLACSTENNKKIEKALADFVFLNVVMRLQRLSLQLSSETAGSSVIDLYAAKDGCLRVAYHSLFLRIGTTMSNPGAAAHPTSSPMATVPMGSIHEVVQSGYWPLRCSVALISVEERRATQLLSSPIQHEDHKLRTAFSLLHGILSALSEPSEDDPLHIGDRAARSPALSPGKAKRQTLPLSHPPVDVLTRLLSVSSRRHCCLGGLRRLVVDRLERLVPTSSAITTDRLLLAQGYHAVTCIALCEDMNRAVWSTARGTQVVKGVRDLLRLCDEGFTMAEQGERGQCSPLAPTSLRQVEVNEALRAAAAGSRPGKPGAKAGPALGALSSASLVSHPRLPLFLSTTADGILYVYDFDTEMCIGGVRCPLQCTTPPAFSQVAGSRYPIPLLQLTGMLTGKAGGGGGGAGNTEGKGGSYGGSKYMRCRTPHPLVYDGSLLAVGLQDGSVALWTFAGILRRVLSSSTSSGPAAATAALPRLVPFMRIRTVLKGSARHTFFCRAMLAVIGMVEEPHVCPQTTNDPSAAAPSTNTTATTAGSGGTGSSTTVTHEVCELQLFHLELPTSYRLVVRVAIPFTVDFATYIYSLHAVLCVSSAGEVCLYQLLSGKVIQLGGGFQGLQRPHGDSVVASPWLPTESTAATTAPGSGASTTSTASGAEQVPPTRITAMSFSEEEDLIAVGTDRGVAYVLPVRMINAFIQRLLYDAPLHIDPSFSASPSRGEVPMVVSGGGDEAHSDPYRHLSDYKRVVVESAGAAVPSSHSPPLTSKIRSIFCFATPLLLTPQLSSSHSCAIMSLVFGPSRVLLAGLQDGKMVAASLAPQGWWGRMMEPFTP